MTTTPTPDEAAALPAIEAIMELAEGYALAKSELDAAIDSAMAPKGETP